MPDEDKRLAEEEAPSVDAPAVRRRRRLIIISSLIFALRFLALAAFFPYIFLWLESNGFDTHERGLLGGINGLTRVLAPTALGALADWTGRRKLIFVTGSLINAVAVAVLNLCDIFHRPELSGYPRARTSTSG